VTFVSPKLLLRRLGLKPRKSWGQHFLLYPHQARRIVAALDLTGRDVVVEIGAGLGALTVFLAPAAARVVALEMDPNLSRFLQEELFPAPSPVQVLCQDALAFDFLGLRREAGQDLVVVGNLPYQITSPLMFKLMDQQAAIRRAVFMVQEEVGDRLTSPPGTRDYGVLSVLMQYYFTLTGLFSLSPANFYPAPQVASVVLSLQPGRTAPPAADEGLLRQVVKAAFHARRKTLNNNLTAQAAAFGLAPGEMKAALAETGIDPQRRGETLSLAEFVALSQAIAAAGKGRG
jgi:16S rRNA (adenine1518-N6/adenine1519-N6)-dimethyltransferase